MSLFALFDIGKSALFANQTALNVVSNNIANVNTPGYSRQEVILEVVTPVQLNDNYIGRGVDAAGIRRHYDKFIHLQMIGQNQSYGRSYALDQGLSQIEQIFNEAKNLGLANALNDYLNAWNDVATNPDMLPERTVLLQKARALLQTAGQMEHDIEDTLKYVNEDIVNVVDKINTITGHISALNEKIAQLEAGLDANKASYFRDERDQLLNDLAELTEYNWYEDANGYVTVLAGGRTLVDSMKSYNLTTQVNIDGDTDIFYQGDKMNQVFTHGQLGGYLAVRDDINNTTLEDLRRLVASIVKETNMLHETGFGLDGSTNNDFFDPLQIYTRSYSSGAYVSSSGITSMSSLTLDEYTVSFVDAANYEVYDNRSGALVTSGAYAAGSPINFDGIQVVIDGAPAAGDSFLVSPLTGVIKNTNVAVTDPQQIAAASQAATLPGDNTNALNIAGLAGTKISDLGNATYEDYYSGIVTNVGVMSAAAADSLAYDDNLRFEIQKKRESVSGVSLDEEAADMIRYQRAYEAGARIIQMTDELLQTIINL